LAAGLLGVGLMFLVRPHVALLVIVGFAVALFARPTHQRSGARLVARLVCIVLLLFGGSYVASTATQFLGTEDDITAALDSTVAQTEQGGAAFKASVVRSPIDYPIAFATVWFRPFPTEASGGGGPQLASSFENMFLLGLLMFSWKQLRTLPRAVIRIPYATYAVVYSLVFVYAFSAIGNFGILARQRTQGTVLFFVVLCLPDLAAASHGRVAKGREARAERIRERLHLHRRPVERVRRNTPYRERAASRSVDP
jgi:hypothetical protein